MLRTDYPELRAQVATGWGSQLVGKDRTGRIGRGGGVVPGRQDLPDNMVGESIGKMELVVVCAKAQLPKKPCKLADVYQNGGILNPDGCGFRAGLQRTLSDQGLALRVNLETFGTELQLGLVPWPGPGFGAAPAAGA